MPIRKRPTTDQLYWRFQYKGRTYEKSMETSNLRDAKERGQRWEVQVKGQVAEPELYPTLAILRDKDVERLRDLGRNERYIRLGVQVNYRALMRFFPDVRAVTADSLEEYVKYRRKQGVRRQTISKELTCLKRGFQLARIKGPDFWPKLPKDKKDPKLSSKRHDIATWRAWLKGLRGEAFEIALFALCTGMRREELYRVQPTDIRTIDGYSVLQVHEKIKRDNQRQIVLGPLAQSVIPHLPFKQDHKGAHAAACKSSPTGNITLRDCRAAFATAADRAGDSRATDLAMGHSGIPARYQKTDYERLAAVALAAETWVTGTVAGQPANRDNLRHPLSS